MHADHAPAVLAFELANRAYFAASVSGRGVATATVREVCRLGAERHGLRTLRGATAAENAASRKVLTKAGFGPVGPADPADLGGRSGTWYQRDLAGPGPEPS